MIFRLLILFLFVAVSYGGAAVISEETRSCINCHAGLTPGIVKDWQSGRHSAVTPQEAWGKPEIARRISKLDEKLKDTVVGCYECHSRNAESHKDSFVHYGHRIHVIVTPPDCASCHPVEVEQYTESKKGHAWGNLAKNPVYHTLVNTIIGPKEVSGSHITTLAPSDYTQQETCFACHGTEVVVEGEKTIQTPLGIIKIPALKNWPNQGVGRINPDASRGSCTACHARHAFSIEMARKPYTCSQCHLEPDVPAWNVYDESKHGNIFRTSHAGWDFNSVPWKLGEDFKAPTCAACHMSLITGPDGQSVIARRSHDVGGRLWVRLFGLIYTHPQPIKGDTSIIRNKDGLPLPTTFEGEPAGGFLIGKEEQGKRLNVMKAVCKGCHSADWTDEHFKKMDSTLKETDGMTLQATRLIREAWRLKIADDSNPFDEPIEQKWVKQWLFYGNSVRYASAMTGAPDYTAFKYGWWGLTTNLLEMREELGAAGPFPHDIEGKSP